ncbi:MAG: hypothetical protein JSU65_07610, partial [Candidatus Zixiibacteriota bacterium]
GLDTSQVTITVRDGNGNLAVDGVEIRLAAGEQFQDVDSSGYWTEGTDIVLQDIDNDGTWDANGLVPSTVTIAGGAGQATFNYISGTTPGAAYIKATIVDPRISGGADFSIQLMSTQGSISVSANPTVIVADGADQSTITIVVRDILGDPVADGTMVKLVAGEWFSDIDQNGIWTPGIDNLVQDANNNGVWDIVGQVPASVTTGGGTGTAVFTYTAGVLPQTAYIKMTIDDPRTSGSRDYPIQLIPDTAIHSIFLMTDSIQIAVTQTGGIEVATLYATGLDARGNPVGGGVPIDFFMVDDPGGGAHLEDGTTGPVREYTNTMGVASTRVHSGTVSGTLRLRATHGTVLSNATQILISAGPPAYIVVGAWECNVDYWDNVGMFNEVTAVVADQYMNPVNDSTVVYFTTDEGTMKSHEERTAFNEGIAKTDWISGNNIGSADGVIWVYAETAGGTVRCSSSFFNTHLADTLRITGWETNLVADGEDKFTAFMTAVDLNGNPVVGGTEFKSDANYVRTAGGTFEDGCYSSDARITVTSRTLAVDRSRSGVTDNGVGAIDYVDYWVTAGASTTMICSLLTGNAYTGTSKINGQNTAAPGEVVSFSVTIMDRWGNPLADHTVNAVASGGVIAGASQTTDSYGEASGYEWTAPLAAGDYTITCTDTDPRGLIVETLIITVE